MKKLLSVFMACLVLLSVPLSAAAAETTGMLSAAKAGVSLGDQVKGSGENETPDSPNTPDVPPKPISDKMIGDADGNESITSNDSLLVLRSSVNLEDIPSNIADVDSDSAITSKDSLLILRYSVGFDDGTLIGIRENQELIDPESIALDKNTLTLTEGDSAQITAMVFPSDATRKYVKWTTSDSSVATVSNGTVKALKVGTATITAATVNGKTALCNVTVKAATIDPTGIKLNTSAVTLEAGKSTILTATVSPSNATDKSVTWTTNNSSVATVSGGTVKALKTGTAIITAKTANGKTAACTVTVKAATIDPTGIKINTPAVTLEVGKSIILVATVSPSNATNKTVTWTTNNSSVATVSGGTVKALKTGTAVITAKTANGKTAACTVTVKAATIDPTGIKLNTSAVTLEAGKSTILTATVSPSNATNKTVTWTTSNSSVATVSGGTVKALKTGTAVITAKTSNGKTATCTVTVKQSNTVEVENCLKLINYIKSNYDFINSSGNKGIKGSPIDDLECSVVYDSSADRILFIAISEKYVNGSKINSVTSLTYDYRNGIVEDETINLAEDKSFGYQADATWKAANIKYKDKITYSIPSLVNISNSQAQGLANSLRDIALLYCGTVVSVRTNLSFADIGFTNYMGSSGSVAVTSISLNKSSVSLKEGTTTTLTATVSPTNATDKSVTWTTSNSSVATVSNGTVKALKAGTATITAKTSNGKTATCTVTVTSNGGSNVQTNCENLKNYILKNPDFINKNSNKGLKKTYTLDSTNLTVGIVYESSTGNFNFIVIQESSSGESISNFVYNYKTGQITDQESWKAASSYMGVIASTGYSVSSIRKGQTISYNISSSVGVSNTNCQKLVNSQRDVALLAVQVLLFDRTKMNLKDIGFTNY